MADEDDFQSLVGDDVKPIAQEKRVHLSSEKDGGVDKEKRRLAALELEVSGEDPLSSEPQEMVGPLDVISYRRPGVQHGVFKNLRLGKYQIDARLDLHRMNVDLARQSVFRFVQDCVANDVRTALITHGKGEGRETPALLKSCVAHWLPQLDEVLACHTAQKQHGSYGATYVLFKKNDNFR
ncbi:MAG: DNA endonuclease SmrA [Agarilytica sp.]